MSQEITSERRRAALRSGAKLMLRLREEIARTSDATLADEAAEMADEMNLASMPAGAVVYRDDDVDMIDLERGDITISMPSETPDDVADALFEIAAIVGSGFGVWDIRGLVAAVRERSDAT